MKKIKIALCVLVSFLITGTLFAAQNKIAAGDQLSIWVKGESDLSVTRVVSNDGSINLPLIGSIGVSGLSSGGASRVIVEMLEDGYLRDPLVQVTLKNNNRKKKHNSRYPTQARPISGIDYQKPSNINQVSSNNNYATSNINVSAANSGKRIYVIDRETGKGINGVAFFMGSRIYQSNRLGQIDLKSATGNIIVIADGYKIISGDFQSFLKPDNHSQIALSKVKLAEKITFHVIDAYSKKPLRAVEVVLDDMKVKTNSKGTFNIKLIKREFGEISLRKKGYQNKKQVVDFKGPETRLILMMRNKR